VLLALIFAAPVIRVPLMVLLNPLAAYLLMPARMDALFAGVLAAWLMRSPPHAKAIERHRALLWIAFAVLLLGVVLASVGSRQYRVSKQTIEYFWMAAFYLVILLLVASARTHRPWIAMASAPLRWAGIGAYTLFLFHFPVLLTMPRFVTSGWVVPASLAVLLPIAFLSWHLIEKPLIALGHRLFPYRAAAAAPMPLEQLSPAVGPSPR
jgi:peptidoglycan/LPS O-acetylase OafA/YrhL